MIHNTNTGTNCKSRRTQADECQCMDKTSKRHGRSTHVTPTCVLAITDITPATAVRKVQGYVGSFGQVPASTTSISDGLQTARLLGGL